MALESYVTRVTAWCDSEGAVDLDEVAPSCSCRIQKKKGSFGKGVLSEEPSFLEILENLEILQNPQTLENKGESDHFLEILDNSENLEIARDSSSEKTPFSCPDSCLALTLQKVLRFENFSGPCRPVECYAISASAPRPL